jgi:hypothetical protein
MFCRSGRQSARGVEARFLKLQRPAGPCPPYAVGGGGQLGPVPGRRHPIRGPAAPANKAPIIRRHPGLGPCPPYAVGGGGQLGPVPGRRHPIRGPAAPANKAPIIRRHPGLGPGPPLRPASQLDKRYPPEPKAHKPTSPQAHEAHEAHAHSVREHRAYRINHGGVSSTG